MPEHIVNQRRLCNDFRSLQKTKKDIWIASYDGKHNGLALNLYFIDAICSILIRS